MKSRKRPQFAVAERPVAQHAFSTPNHQTLQTSKKHQLLFLPCSNNNLASVPSKEKEWGLLQLATRSDTCKTYSAIGELRRTKFNTTHCAHASVNGVLPAKSVLHVA